MVKASSTLSGFSGGCPRCVHVYSLEWSPPPQWPLHQVSHAVAADSAADSATPQSTCMKTVRLCSKAAPIVVMSAGIHLCATLCINASGGSEKHRADRSQSLHTCTLCWPHQPRSPIEALFSVPTFPSGLAMLLLHTPWCALPFP